MSNERRPSRKPPGAPVREERVGGIREERIGPVDARAERSSTRPGKPPSLRPGAPREERFGGIREERVGPRTNALAEEIVRRPAKTIPPARPPGEAPRRTGKTVPPARPPEESVARPRKSVRPGGQPKPVPAPTLPAPPEHDVVIPARPLLPTGVLPNAIYVQKSPLSPPRMPGAPIAQAPVAQRPATPAPMPAVAPAPAPVAPAVVAVKPALSNVAPGTPGQNRIDRFLKLMNDRGASDLHLSVGRPPIFRLSGRMEPIRYRTLDRSDFTQLLEAITPAHLWAEFVETGDVDFAYEIPNVSRFRVNLFRQERGDAAVLRVIPTKLMTVAQLGLPESIRKIVHLRSGLVLVTGPTGSGKSTTLSAIINEMNETRRMHFVTIEDPIEFVHPNKKSLMSQREIGPHSRSFSTALRAAVREDPDAILVGEMRDLETISMALAAAETGVLVFGTLHTNSAAKTIDRVVNVFPADRQPGVRGTLASVLKGVVAQQLLRKKKGGRCAAVEILFGSNAMASMIRDGKSNQISGLIKLGKKDGMIAMDDALKALVDDESIEPLAGLEKAIDKDDFRKWLKERGIAAPDDAH